MEGALFIYFLPDLEVFPNPPNYPPNYSPNILDLPSTRA